MEVLIAFLITTFLLGSGLGRWMRDRPILLLGFCVVVAASFYSLRVVQ
jgi:hypothetical protein